MKKLLFALLLSLLVFLPQQLFGQSEFVDVAAEVEPEVVVEEEWQGSEDSLQECEEGWQGDETTDTDGREAYDGYYIELMNVDITIHADRTYDIVEDIYTNFVEPRHGIVRDIPNYFWVNRDISEVQDSSKYKLLYNHVDIDKVSVSEQYAEEDGEEVKSLRIGSSETTIEGQHHYHICYRLKLPNDRVKYSDNIFHSIVGSEWTCSMDSVHFVVHFDKELPDASFDKLRLYVGSVGSIENRAHDVIDNADYHTIEGSVLELPSQWAITLDIPLPEGYFPTDDYPIWPTLSWIMAGVTLLFLLMVGFREIRGDEPVASVVTFRPRKDMTSADIGSLIDGEVDNEDLLSMIPWFAAHGYLSIEQEDKKTILHKRKPLPGNAPEYQQTLFTAFFAKGDTFDISKSSSAFGGAWNRARASLKKQYEGKLNTYESLPLLVLSTVALSLTVCFSQVEPDGWIVGGVVNVLLVALVLIVYSARNYWHNELHFTSCVTFISSAWMLIVVGFGVFLGLCMLISIPASFKDLYLPNEVVAGLMTLMLLVILFMRRLLRMTTYRRERLAEVLGLREFIATAEEDRLRMLLSQDERYFYNILPYAMTFGMVDQWAKKFENLSVKEIEEFGHTPVTQISHCVNRSQWTSHVANSVTNYRSASAGGSGRAGGSRGGYSGGGSGGGGGHSW